MMAQKSKPLELAAWGKANRQVKAMQETGGVRTGISLQAFREYRAKKYDRIILELRAMGADAEADAISGLKKKPHGRPKDVAVHNAVNVFKSFKEAMRVKKPGLDAALYKMTKGELIEYACHCAEFDYRHGYIDRDKVEKALENSGL